MPHNDKSRSVYTRGFYGYDAGFIYIILLGRGRGASEDTLHSRVSPVSGRGARGARRRAEPEAKKAFAVRKRGQAGVGSSLRLPTATEHSRDGKKRLEARAVSHSQLAPQKAFVRVATADSRRARKCTQHAVRYRSSSLCLCRLTIANPCNYSSKPPTGPAGGGATWGQETGGGGAIHTPRHGDGGVRWGCRGRRTCVTMMLGPGGASGMLSSSAISASTLAASAASMDAICACSSFSLASAISSAAALPQVEST
jgi:hypothetical protein